MRILIDATNIVTGGGVSHLTELLNATSWSILTDNEIEKIIIVGINATLNKIHDHPWIIKIPMEGYESSLLKRQYWKFVNIKQIIKRFDTDLVFNPGGAFFTLNKKIKYVTMCRNMLIFEKEEANRFGCTLYRFKFFLLKILQTYSMKHASGVIFISEYGKNYIKRMRNMKIKQCIVIHHGISKRFSMEVKPQLNIKDYNINRPYKLLYVSIIDVYKHQDIIAKAVIKLAKDKGYPIRMIFVGKKAGGYKKLRQSIIGNEPFFEIYDNVPFEKVHQFYSSSDLFVFASTCENMPNILIEAMSSGLPIVCSKKLPMPEFLKEGGVYFDALDAAAAERAIEDLLKSSKRREMIAKQSKEYSFKFDWEKCAIETFKFLRQCSSN